MEKEGGEKIEETITSFRRNGLRRYDECKTIFIYVLLVYKIRARRDELLAWAKAELITTPSLDPYRHGRAAHITGTLGARNELYCYSLMIQTHARRFHAPRLPPSTWMPRCVTWPRSVPNAKEPCHD